MQSIRVNLSFCSKCYYNYGWSRYILARPVSKCSAYSRGIDIGQDHKDSHVIIMIITAPSFIYAIVCVCVRVCAHICVYARSCASL